jgi:hypothetical protein
MWESQRGQSGAEIVNGAERFSEGLAARRLDMKEPLRSPASFGRAGATARGDITFALQAVERCIDGTESNQTSGLLFDLLPDSHAIGIGFQPDQGEQDLLLKGPK